MTARCGSRVIWHWAHSSRRHCDPWWENETAWHRQWKSHFPESWREVVHHASDGEKHVADVKTARGMTIEFQNSDMSPEELQSREDFYGRMMWIVNATKFKARLHILSPLPDPNAEFMSDIVFMQERAKRPGKNLQVIGPELCFFRRSESGDNPGRGDMVEVHSFAEIKDQIDAHHVGHYMFEWQRPRTVWYEANAPVFFDLGGPILWWLQTYDNRGLRCVRRVEKAALVAKNGGAYSPEVSE